MTITRIDVHSVTLHFARSLTTTYGTSFETENFILKVFTSDDLIGLGEASPSAVTRESVKSITSSLDKLAPTLRNADELEIDVVLQKMDQEISGNPSAKAAIDIALHDILGQRTKKPLFELFGGFREITTDITISSREPTVLSQDALNAVNNGFRALKIKAGFSQEEDLERIKAVRDRVGPNVALRVDANQGWKVDQTIKLLGRLEAFDLEFIEQPVKAHDFKGLRKIREHSTTPIMADESVCSPRDALEITKKEAVDSINIKLMKSGGLLRANEIVKIAEQCKVSCMIGCMCESNIGISAAVHLASALTNIKYADLDSDILLKDKLVLEGGARTKNSQRIPPHGSGLGIIKMDEKLLSNPVRSYLF